MTNQYWQVRDTQNHKDTIIFITLDKATSRMNRLNRVYPNRFYIFFGVAL